MIKLILRLWIGILVLILIGLALCIPASSLLVLWYVLTLVNTVVWVKVTAEIIMIWFWIVIITTMWMTKDQDFKT